MMSDNLILDFEIDPDLKQIRITKYFNSTIEQLWIAWSDPYMLKKWWLPAPFLVLTKSFEFVEAGQWHYAVIAPDGQKFWALLLFKHINYLAHISASNVFSDAKAQTNKDLPSMEWLIEFSQQEYVAILTSTIVFQTTNDLTMVIEMGFQESFTMSLVNLENVLNEMHHSVFSERKEINFS